MWKLTAAVVVLGLLGLAGHSAHAAPGAFEGEVVVKFTKPFPVTISYLIKGKKMFSAVEGTTEPMTMVDLEKLEVYHFVLDHKYKVAKLPPRDTRPPVRVPVKSGKTKMLGGQSCEEWVEKDSSSTMRYWVMPGTSFEVHPWYTTGDFQSGFDFLRTKNLFPVGMSLEDKSGKVTAFSEAIKIQKKKVDPSVLSIPAGYKPEGK